MSNFTGYELLSGRRLFEDDCDELMWDGRRFFRCRVKSLDGVEATLTVHHHTEYDNPADWADLWDVAELLCCCMPNYLPEHMRKIHVLPEVKGKVCIRRRGYYLFFWEDQGLCSSNDEYFDKEYAKFCETHGLVPTDEFDLDNELI